MTQTDQPSRSAASRDQTNLADRPFAVQAADTEIRPHLLRAILDDDPARQAIALCKGKRGFNGGSKAGEHGQGSCNVGRNRDR
jgi:hypothetical protein